MKKVIYLSLIVLSFFMFNNRVNAITFGQERNRDFVLQKTLGDKGAIVFGGRIYVNGTNEYAYCVEPFGELNNNGTYYSYNGDPSKLGLNQAKVDRIKQIAYFGYGYGNHTDKKWTEVTKIMIWRAAHPEGQFDFLESISNKVVVHTYDNEINEINNLISNNEKKPSFYSEDEIILKNDITLTDTNEVLKYYTIKSMSFVNARIENNNLVIEKPNEVGSGEILFEKVGNLHTESVFYYNSESQNVMVRGDFTPITFKLKVAVVKGSITIKKIDQDLEVNESQGEGKLNEAVFELSDSNNNLIRELTLGENGTVTVNDLELGSYIIRETTPGYGYLNNNEEYLVEITKDNKDIELIIPNKVIKSTLKVKKYYGSKRDFDNNTMRVENGVLFELYDKDDNLLYECITDELGEFEVTLPFGTYKLVQKTTSTNFKMVEDQIIVVDSSSPTTIELVLKDIEIEVPNAGLYESTLEETFDICLVSLNKYLY